MQELEARMEILEQRERKRADVWTRIRAKIIHDMLVIGIPKHKAEQLLPAEMPESLPDDWKPL